MSIINQVLNELEKRGVTVPLEEGAIRSVSLRRQSHLLRYTLLAVLLVLLVLAAKWYVARHETAASVPVPVVVAKAPVVPQLVAGLLDQSAAMPVIAPPASKMSYGISATPAPKLPPASPPVENPPEPAVISIHKTPALNGNKVAAKVDKSSAADAATSPFKKISQQQRAENEFRDANLAAQQGKSDEAIAGYRETLRLDPMHHAARRAMAGALLAVKRNADAEELLQEGLKLDSHETSFSMLLARLQVERDAVPLALATLEQTLPYASQQPDYQAFMAALQQRQNQHNEAIVHFQAALQLVPNNGVWLMGLGISLEALQRNQEARDAYQRALATQSLPPELTAFVQQKLSGL